MICGLCASIFIMIIEMALFIVRAVQLENAYENPSSKRTADSKQRIALTEAALPKSFSQSLTPSPPSAFSRNLMDSSDDEAQQQEPVTEPARLVNATKKTQ